MIFLREFSNDKALEVDPRGTAKAALVLRRVKAPPNFSQTLY